MSMSRHALEQEYSVRKSLTLIERVVERENMKEAYRRVKGNKGAAGIDKMTVDDLAPFLRENWPQIKEQILRGEYKPRAVKRVEIDKADGGKRLLGIPTVLDRLIQQALHQILSPLFEEDFSQHSYGFRPLKSAHQAVCKSREYIASGHRWVVDMDLKSFFDEVNHDRLMSRLALKVKDRQVLSLVRDYLRCGVLLDGVVNVSSKGTPQGGPLSPLLSNIVLDELDRELERRGHLFCRYADDCNIYVKSRRSGERVLSSICNFVEGRLKLKVNYAKSAVDRPWKRKFLGYSFTSQRATRLKVAKASIKRFKDNVKQLCRMGRGRNLKRFISETLNPSVRGWINYFRLSEVKKFAEELDGWLRRRLRCIIWRQWKRPRTRRKMLIKLGFDEYRASKSAYNGRGPWWNAGASHMNEAFKKKFFDNLGLVSMLDVILGFVKS